MAAVARALATLPLRMLPPKGAASKAPAAAAAAGAGKAAPPAKAQKVGGAAPTTKGKMAATTAAGTVLQKGAADPPLAPSKDYPTWLWALAKPVKTLRELRTHERKGDMPKDCFRRFFDLRQRVAIKEKNSDLAGSR